jgi:site-specific DNA-cytosine methylase|tara:strand:+ start:135 stop:740 length:606 start_codon:yes stop_codon:yes gene_type:complete
MKVLELFAGSRSFSKVAEEMGMETFTTDFKDFNKIDYVVDILDFVPMKVPFKPDIIWASPPCTTFSIASCSTHWTKDKKPKTEKCLKGIKIVETTLKIIDWFKPKYFFIENPRGLLRKMDFMNSYNKATVTYCQYGDSRMKPTDIWTNNINWKPRPMCKNGMPCHESAPRGSKTGTQGLKGNYKRSIVPYKLCKEILKSCI